MSEWIRLKTGEVCQVLVNTPDGPEWVEPNEEMKKKMEIEEEYERRKDDTPMGGIGDDWG